MHPLEWGGLNCIELNIFFMAIQINWFKMYINYKQDDFLTATLDKFIDAANCKL